MSTEQQQQGAAGGTGGQGGEQQGGPQQQQAAPWFSDTQKDYVSNKGWKAPTDVIDAYTNLEKLVGADRAGRTLVMPKDENDAEGLKAFRAKLGVPESPEKYAVPDALKNDPLIGDFAKQAHALGIPAKSFDAMMAWVQKAGADQEAALLAQQKAESEKQLNELRTKWGGDFDKNAEFARRFLQSSGMTKEQMEAVEGAIGTRAMLELFHGWGSKTGEAGFSGGNAGDAARQGGGFAVSKAAVQKQIDELRAKRIANQVSEKDFHAEMAKLGPLLDSAA